MDKDMILSRVQKAPEKMIKAKIISEKDIAENSVRYLSLLGVLCS